MCIEGAGSKLLLFTVSGGKKLLEELPVSRFTFAGISHLSHLLHELSNGLAVLEWAASLKSRAVASQALALGDKDGIWTHTFAKCWTRIHRIVQGNSHGSLKNMEIFQINKNESKKYGKNLTQKKLVRT